MEKVKKDIFGKQIGTVCVTAGELSILDNLQKQLTAMYLFLERKGLLENEEFKDFADSIVLAEQIEKMNGLEDPASSPVKNEFAYVLYNEEKTEYRNADPNALIGSLCNRRRYIEDKLTNQSYDLDDSDDVRKLVEVINKRLN